MKFHTLETPSLYKGLIHGALKLADKGKAAPPRIHKLCIPETKAIDEEKRIIDHFISSDREDRDWDIIEQDGFIYDEFDINPVVLEGHLHWLRPIANCIQHVIEKHGEFNFTRAKTQYPPLGVKASSEEDFNMRLHKFLTTWSVGFRPVEWGWREDRGIHFFRQIMLEYSSVSIPANTDAVDLSMDSDSAMKTIFASLYPGQAFDKNIFENIMEEAAKKEFDKRSDVPGCEALKLMNEASDELRGYALRSTLQELKAWCHPNTPAAQPQGAGAEKQ